MEKKNRPLKITLTNSSKNLKLLFPDDPNGDLRIKYKQNSYKLQKNFLILHSSYFCQKAKQTGLDEINITQDFDVHCFSDVLAILYGNQIQMQRDQIKQYYRVINFLGIQQAKNIIRNDVLRNIALYNIFLIIAIAQYDGDQQLFQVCLSQLQSQNFAQTVQNVQKLLSLNLNLFKFVIKAYSKHTQDNQNSDSQSKGVKIYNIIKKYCQLNNYDKSKLEQMSFELINIKLLTSNQFKQIFMCDEGKKIQRKASLALSISLMKSLIVGQSSKSKQISHNTPPQGGAQSIYLQSMCQGNLNIQQLKIENMYLNKKVNQLQIKNEYLQKQLKQLLQVSIQHQNTQKQLQQNLKLINQELAKQIKKKQQFEKYHKYSMKKCEQIINKLYNELDKANEKMTEFAKTYSLKLSREFSERQKQNSVQLKPSKVNRAGKVIPALEVHNMFVHLVGRQTNSAHKRPVPSPLKLRSKTQSKYIPRNINFKYNMVQKFQDGQIKFAKQPISISRSNIKKLCQMLLFQSFSKKNLHLIFRRAPNLNPEGERDTIFGKNPLVILIKTGTQKQIGCYIRISIPKKQQFYGEDKHSFAFSLTHNEKLKLDAVQKADKIEISDQYFLSFGSILKIGKNPQIDTSYCIWPQNGKMLCNGISQEQFTGNNQFTIESMEIYEIQEVDIEMII